MAKAENAARSKSLFGNYDIVETVGQGGMGVVYRAQDTALDRVVALKVLKEDLRSHAAIVERFRREGEAFASLNHPNIVHIYSVGSVGSIPYIAMEYIEGEPLSRRMKREKRIDWQEALEIGQQIAEALASAHDASIIHRDIKPANILINKDNHAYVTDFGIAKILTAETSLTIDGARLGTPQYMSPERCENRDTTAASDIYSLGVVLFQLITGSLPYEADTPMSLVREITTVPPKRLLDLVPNVPKDVERLVAFMIEKEPKNRPRSAHEVAVLIARVREGKPLSVNESGLRQALEEFRDGINTPTPGSTSHFDSARQDGIKIARWLRTAWDTIPSGVKFFITAALVAVVSGLAGMQIAAWMNRGYAIGLVERTGTESNRWQQSARVADFTDEAPAVILASILLPKFAPTRLAWLSPDEVLVAVEGHPGTSRQGESAVILLSPIDRLGTIALEPVNATVTVHGVSPRHDMHPPGFYYSSSNHNGELDFWNRLDHSLSAIIASSDPMLGPRVVPQYGPISVDPVSGEMLISVSGIGPPNTWTLIRRATDSATGTPVYSELTHHGLPIEALAHSRDSPLVVYIETESGAEKDMWAFDPASPQSERLMATGGFAMSPGAFAPSGPQFVVINRVPGANTEIQIYDAQSGLKIADLGPGFSAEWANTGDYVIVTDSDAKGNLQLWAIDRVPPHRRRQLTFLERGISSQCAVSPDGLWAVSSIETRENTAIPELVFVSLAPEQPSTG